MDLVRRPLVVAQGRQRLLAGHHDDQVVRVDRLEAGGRAPAPLVPSSGAQRTSSMVTGSRLLSASDRPALDVHDADDAPLLGQAVERDAASRGRAAREPAPAPAAASGGLLALEEVERHVSPPPRRYGTGSAPRRRRRRGSWCRRARGPGDVAQQASHDLAGPGLGQVGTNIRVFGLAIGLIFVADVLAQLVAEGGRRLVAEPQDDERVDRLARDRVGAADDRGLGDGRVGDEARSRSRSWTVGGPTRSSRRRPGRAARDSPPRRAWRRHPRSTCPGSGSSTSPCSAPDSP